MSIPTITIVKISDSTQTQPSVVEFEISDLSNESSLPPALVQVAIYSHTQEPDLHRSLACEILASRLQYVVRRLQNDCGTLLREYNSNIP